jgi:transposase
MRKANKFELSNEDLKIISDTIKYEKRVEGVKRATALRLLHEGKTPDEVAEFLGVTAPSIHHWRKRWQAGQQAGLSNGPIAGRPRKTTAQYWEKLAEVLEQNPRDLGVYFQYLDDGTPRHSQGNCGEWRTLTGLDDPTGLCLSPSTR